MEILNGVGPGEKIPGYDRSSSSRQGYSSVRKDQEEPEELIDFLQDDISTMTYGRRIALYMMKKYAWYNPQLSETEEKSAGDIVIDEGRYRSQDGYPITHSKEEKPSLEKAWAYFDHVALPRYLFEPKENNEKKGILTRIIRKWSKANKQLQRAEPGEAEHETRLYSTLFTPHKQLGDLASELGKLFAFRLEADRIVLANLHGTKDFIFRRFEA